MTDTDSGRVGAAEQALVNEAGSRLHPSGFDPSRGDVVLRREVFDFLMGTAAYDETWFGDLNDGLPGRFWWRAVLRAAQRESAQGMETRQGGDGTAPSRSDDSPVVADDAPNNSSHPHPEGSSH